MYTRSMLIGGSIGFISFAIFICIKLGVVTVELGSDPFGRTQTEIRLQEKLDKINAEQNKLNRLKDGFVKPVPEFGFDQNAQNSELGKLSKFVLGEFYVNILSIDLKAEDKALVTARVGNMDCAMGYVSITSEVDNKPVWKLDNLKCQ